MTEQLDEQFEGEVDETEALALLAVEAAFDRKGLDATVIDVRGKASYADFLVIVTGRNDRHVAAIADSIDGALSPHVHSFGREGLAGGHWVLLDFGDVIAHVFYAPTRKLYDIEGLWTDARRLELEIPDELRAEPTLYEGYEERW